MNCTHGYDDKAIRFDDRVKATVLLCVLGFIVMIADHALVAPSEASATDMAGVLLAPSVASDLAADGGVDAIARIAVPPQGPSADRRDIAPAGRPQTEPDSDTVRDEDGHPRSF